MSTVRPTGARLIAAALAVVVVGIAAGCGGSDDARLAAEASASSAAAALSSAISASSLAAASSAAAASSSAAAVASAAAAAEASRVAAAAAMAAAAQAAQQSQAAQQAQQAQGPQGATGDPAAVAAHHEATIDAARATADLDAPGDDAGAPCPTDGQYFDEQPIGLQPQVLAAWQDAVSRAAAAGITLCLNDGKRSRAQQQATYDAYVVQFGQAMADQYVLPPEKSAHVLGLAVDVQPLAGHNWLEQTGGALGFCRTYDNETWHFEYDQEFITQGCPTRTAHPGG